jgi:hypothetical protein
LPFASVALKATVTLRGISIWNGRGVVCYVVYVELMMVFLVKGEFNGGGNKSHCRFV